MVRQFSHPAALSLAQSLPIECREVVKEYPNGVTALDRVSLTIEPGEMVSLVGRSGAGKTTLLRCLNGLIKPTSGQILVGGQDISGLRGKALRAHQKTAGMVFQQFNLVKRLKVLSNVLVGRLPHKEGLSFWLAAFGWFSEEERRAALRCLEQVGIPEQAPKRVDRLSGGQQQRVAIAKILLQNPCLILADEPIASLDPYSSETVMETLWEINRCCRTTIILNMHYLDYAKRFSTRVVGLRHGRVVFDGPPAKLTEAMEGLIYGDGVERAPSLREPVPLRAYEYARG
jgi:phosphonate transport system ATP-binding protein